ncbi:MAG: hypothetical protein AB7O04_10560 [Hyphomonadaceae bacterium]
MSIEALAAEVEADARTLRAASVYDAPYFAGLADFSADAMALSTSLREAGLTDDLPCIFRGISEDAHVRAAEIQSAEGAARAMAVSGLNALLDDAILLAPMAAEAASAE